MIQYNRSTIAPSYIDRSIAHVQVSVKLKAAFKRQVFSARRTAARQSTRCIANAAKQ